MTIGCDSSWHHRSWCCLWRDRRHKRGKSTSCSISCEHQMSRPVKQICQTCVTIVAWQHTMILQWTAKPASLCKGVEVYKCVCINIISGIYRVHCVQTCWYVIHVYMNSMWIYCLGLAARYGWYVTDGLLERPLGCIQRGTSGTCGVLTCCSRHHFYRFFRWIKRQNKIALLATHTLSSRAAGLKVYQLVQSCRPLLYQIGHATCRPVRACNHPDMSHTKAGHLGIVLAPLSTSCIIIHLLDCWYKEHNSIMTWGHKLSAFALGWCTCCHNKLVLQNSRWSFGS